MLHARCVFAAGTYGTHASTTGPHFPLSADPWTRKSTADCGGPSEDDAEGKRDGVSRGKRDFGPPRQNSSWANRVKPQATFGRRPPQAVANPLFTDSATRLRANSRTRRRSSSSVDANATPGTTRSWQ